MKYSITIPAYKAKYLGRSIESVLAQTYNDFELIIVNDASPEDLDSVVNSFEDKRIRYYKNEVNRGAESVVDNWNRCLNYALGDYLICMGDDDELTPDCLAQYNSLMDRYPNLDLYHARTIVIDENSEFCNLQESRPEFESMYSMMWHMIVQGRIQFIGDFLFKRQTLLANGGFYKLPLAWGTDNISSFIAASKTGVANGEKPTFRSRRHSQSLTIGGYSDAKFEAINMEERWYEEFLAACEPVTQIDKYMVISLGREIGYHFRKKKVFLLSKDLSCSNFFRLFHWLSKHQEARLSKLDIIYALISSVKLRIQRKNNM